MAYLAKTKKRALIPNVSIIGNPAIKDGVVSGFNATNYLRFPYTFDPKNNTWEQLWKVKTGSEVTSRQHFSCLDGNIGNYKGATVALQNSAFQFLFSVNGTSWYSQAYGAATIKPSTDYWFSFSFDGTSYKLQISLDGINFEDYLVYNESAPMHPNPSPDYVGIGWDLASIWTGSIDFNESYVKINDEYFWKGMDYSVPNYAINGAPFVEPNGLVSNFSASNYLTLPKAFSPNDAWEILFKVNVGSISDYQTILASVASSTSAPTESKGTIGAFGGIHLLINSAYKLILYLSSINTSWNILNGSLGSSILTVGTDYWVKLVFTGTQYILYLSTTGEFSGEETNEININSTTSLYPRYYMIGLNGTDSKKYWGGSIDLSQSYIKIGDEIWWSKDKTGSKVLSYPANRKIRRYYKKQYQDFVQPVFTGDGVVGVNSIGCANSIGTYYSSMLAWNAFDNNVNTWWFKNTGSAYLFTSSFNTSIRPFSVKITNGKYNNRCTSPRNIKIEASVDNTNWETISDTYINTNNTTGAMWEIPLRPIKDYRIFRLNVTSVNGGGDGPSIAEIKYTGQEFIGVAEVSSDDYFPVTQGFTSLIGVYISNKPKVTAVDSGSDLYKVYWESLKGEDGTYTEPAYTSYIKKSEFEALKLLQEIPQYNEDGSSFDSPKIMYKTDVYLESGKSYRIGNADIFYEDIIKTYVVQRKIRKYYKYTYADWSQPTLISNGTIGGKDYGCSLTNARNAAYLAFDKNNGTYLVSTALPATLIFYSPEVLKISSISITNRDYLPESLKDYSIQVSMDGVSYQQIGAGTSPNGAAGATWNCELNSESPNIRCKYIRFNLINTQSAAWVSISEIYINALYQDGVTKGTPDDYDYYVDVEL